MSVEDNLRDELEKLKKEANDAAFEAASLKDNIADLSKLVETASTSKKEYEAAYPALKAAQAELEAFRTGLLPDLKRELRPEGVEKVKESIKGLVDEIDEKKAEVIGLKGFVPDARESSEENVWKRGAVGDAAAEVAKAEKTFAAASTRLEHVKKLAAGVAARHKKMSAAKDEITKLSQTGHEATAFWLLTEGCRSEGEQEPEHDPCADTTPTPLPAGDFFSGMVEPKLIKPEDHDIEGAWNAFQAARDDLNDKRAILKLKEDELKALEKTLDDLTKNLGKNIREALAEWQLGLVDPSS
ncbi:hypothetical protein DEA8626_03016 [Defluviimonas aquaemixtae]|uniref:Uncharacterized protein n=1 Tax=Albidovulum aquaemixtae TaxID=1542388 RepID=A0A2R8BKR0_9RHOB|nr:hypothetical protein [Defluviimonas aquaemixtae]SPH23939.1 hypothetical protein DEA8626_03016 [Defluviimonas aquaemixtae]